MPDTTPKQWQCKHCHELADPTMALCWNCGHDRDGVAQPAMFVDGVDVDLSVCSGCSYELKGNPDATACPECGEPVPWEDCNECGVRSSRFIMAQGCPACQATAEGRAFMPEVQRKALTHCPRCDYDLRGLADSAKCPECGREIGQGVYDTVVMPVASALSEHDPVMLRRRRFWVIALIAMLPMFIVMAELIAVLDGKSEGQYTGLLFAGWVIATMFCIIQLLVTHAKLRRLPHVDKRPL